MLSSLKLAQTIDAHKNAIWKLCFEPVQLMIHHFCSLVDKIKLCEVDFNM